jgi:hypothetical protein
MRPCVLHKSLLICRRTNVAKLVFKRLKAGRSSGAAPRGVGKKRVASEGGGWKTVRTLDANSANFDEGLQYVFRKNVAKARRENKRILGVTDIAPGNR